MQCSKRNRSTARSAGGDDADQSYGECVRQPGCLGGRARVFLERSQVLAALDFLMTKSVNFVAKVVFPHAWPMSQSGQSRLSDFRDATAVAPIADSPFRVVK